MKNLVFIILALAVLEGRAQGKYFGGDAGSTYSRFSIPQYTVLHLQKDPELLAFPNPVRYRLHFSVPLRKEAQLTNIRGEVVLRLRKGSSAVDVFHLKPGCYFLRINRDPLKIMIK